MYWKLLIRESIEIDEGQGTRPYRPFNLAAGLDSEDNHQVHQSLDHAPGRSHGRMVLCSVGKR